MLVNYILVGMLMKHPTDAPWLNMRIEKPHTYITECLAEGRTWEEQAKRNAIAAIANNETPTGFIWDCVRVAGK